MNILKMIVQALFIAILKATPVDKLEALFKEVAEEWIEKHLTPKELLLEMKDLFKLIKERL